MNDKNIATLLLVDDDEDFIWTFRMQFEKEGFRVVSALDRATGMKLAETEKPDLAILDLMMDEVDGGLVMAFQLKKLYPEMPVIMATALSRDTGMYLGTETREDRSWVRADKVLNKPVRFEQMLKEVRLLLGMDTHVENAH
jgi:two-component system alkaline phosphatase synthesis response regulator PhoP